MDCYIFILGMDVRMYTLENDEIPDFVYNSQNINNSTTVADSDILSDLEVNLFNNQENISGKKRNISDIKNNE